jgi:hypothetical protein
MTERELGNFSEWPLKELREKEGSFPKRHKLSDEIRAEICRRTLVVDRRRAQWNQRYVLVSVIIAIVSAFASILYGLDRGIYIGSTSFVDGGLLYKKCKYLFVTGISELPSHGGPLETGIAFRGVQPTKEPDNLYCRLFAE